MQLLPWAVTPTFHHCNHTKGSTQQPHYYSDRHQTDKNLRYPPRLRTVGCEWGEVASPLCIYTSRSSSSPAHFPEPPLCQLTGSGFSRPCDNICGYTKPTNSSVFKFQQEHMKLNGKVARKPTKLNKEKSNTEGSTNNKQPSNSLDSDLTTLRFLH